VYASDESLEAGEPLLAGLSAYPDRERKRAQHAVAVTNRFALIAFDRCAAVSCVSDACCVER
jgi:hypothetical protein